jgi:ABC-type uncharacterized transport system ATPase subunit
MKQKLGLACTLIRTPQLLLLDEPSVGVDPISRRELWKMVYALVDQGIGVVWSTSYLDEAERCAEVLLLNGGKVLYVAQPKELTGRVAAYLAARGLYFLRSIIAIRRYFLSSFASPPLRYLPSGATRTSNFFPSAASSATS